MYSGGSNFGLDLQRTGFNSLARSIKNLNLVPPTGSKLHLAYITASLGALSDGLLTSIYSAASGKINSSAPTRATKATGPVSKNARETVTVLFPSLSTVNTSTGGPDNAGTICLAKKSYDQETWPREILRDYVSTRHGMLSHAKTILAHTTGAKEPDKNVAWVFVGSSNFTESAWGKVVKDRAKGQMKLVCRNWECGIIMPVLAPEDCILDTENPRAVFEPVLDIPCEFPGKKYEDEDEPWFFMNHHGR